MLVYGHDRTLCDCVQEMAPLINQSNAGHYGASLSGSDTAEVCCRLISLTAQHVELYLTLFALPAGRKTAQHVELYLILFAWLILPLLLRRNLSRSLLRLHAWLCLTFGTWIYTRMRIVKWTTGRTTCHAHFSKQKLQNSLELLNAAVTSHIHVLYECFCTH